MAKIIQKIPNHIDLQINFSDVLNLANFPSDCTFLFLLIENDDVKSQYQAFFVENFLLRNGYCASVAGLFEYNFSGWDFGIAISDEYIKFPAYFLYLLGSLFV